MCGRYKMSVKAINYSKIFSGGIAEEMANMGLTYQKRAMFLVKLKPGVSVRVSPTDDEAYDIAFRRKESWQIEPVNSTSLAQNSIVSTDFAQSNATVSLRFPDTLPRAELFYKGMVCAEQVSFLSPLNAESSDEFVLVFEYCTDSQLPGQIYLPDYPKQVKVLLSEEIYKMCPVIVTKETVPANLPDTYSVYSRFQNRFDRQYVCIRKCEGEIAEFFSDVVENWHLKRPRVS